ncbi:MAG: NfeD family protein [Oligoflexia bacterium]|nr:NfeD family protein [Oligoflexia bacterium]MBF0365508.1 NfeD family protein [Oligoflexia bacterium]
MMIIISKLTPYAAYIWMVLGLVIALLELCIPGFIFIFFGVGAFVVGTLLLIVDLSFKLQLFLFMILSLTSLILFRKYAKGRFKGQLLLQDDGKGSAISSKDAASLLGEQAVVIVDIIPAKAQGKVEVHGTSWSALSSDGSDIASGTSVVIMERNNLTLIVGIKDKLQN